MKSYQDINKETIDRWVEEVGSGVNLLPMKITSRLKMENGKYFLLLLFLFLMNGLET